jgi:hypothetical protein
LLLRALLGDQLTLAFDLVQVAPIFVDRQTSLNALTPSLFRPPISTILPSDSETLVGDNLASHPELAFIRVHDAPLSVDLHVSFLKDAPFVRDPPINTILSSGSATLV